MEKTKNKKVPIKKENKEMQENKDKFLFYALIFIAVAATFNFCFYLFNYSKKSPINLSSKGSAITQVDASLSPNNNLIEYSDEGISFSYPKASVMKKAQDGSILIDNWSMDFYKKGSNYSDFNSWFGMNFGKGSCSPRSLDAGSAVELGYSMYFVDGVNCANSGFYMVGKSKVAKVELGGNPFDSYQDVLASLKF